MRCRRAIESMIARGAAAIVVRRALPLLALAVALAAGAAVGGELSLAPILRIETGMHGAAINRLAVTRDGTELVTASDDKTVRRWSIADGEMRAIMRGPIGDGPEGALYAVALSPSQRNVAVAGHTGISWDSNASIYFFDRERAAWVGRVSLGTVPTDVVNHLAFSPDGRFIAVAANDKRGLRVVDLTARSVQVVDAEYGDAIVWLDFAEDGRLVTSSLDGGVRLYDKGLKRQAVWRAPPGRRPWSVAFAPGGGRIAVGFLDGARAAVLGGKDLKLDGEFAGAQGRLGALSVVAWSADGKALFGAGSYGDANGRKLVRRWPLPRGEASDIAVGNDVVNDLAPLSGGRLVFATAEPSWGIIGADGKMVSRRGREQADFRDGYRFGFAVSPDGNTVDFASKPGEGKPARFDLIAADLIAAPRPGAAMKAPLDANGGTRITDWRNTERPKVNGAPLALDANERARSVDVAADGSFVVGGDYFLRRFRDAKELWRSALPAPAWVVAIAEEAGQAVAGLGDGTLRWFRLSDGAELLALFPHPDGKRWVAWTPEGFFDHGPGGATLIGYHLNGIDRGRPRGADFVKVEQLYNMFFRRDLVVKRLKGGAEEEIREQLARIGDVRTVLGRGLPPTLKISDYCAGTGAAAACASLDAKALVRGTQGGQTIVVQEPRVVLRFVTENRGGGLGRVVVRRNGATMPGGRAGARMLTAESRNDEREVPLEPGLNFIALSAFNAAGEIEMDPDQRPGIVVRYDAPRQDQPRLHVLAVGIDRFVSPDVPPLQNAAADARAMSAIMREDKTRRLFAAADVETLLDEDATLERIDLALQAIVSRVQPNDVTLVFLAGHGVAIDGQYYYLPHDLPQTGPDTIRARALSQERLVQILGQLPAWRAAVVLDTCYSGAFAVGDSVVRTTRDQTTARQMSHASGRFILSGSQSHEEALDGLDGHGVFTSVLLAGLQGAADREVRGNRDGKVDVFELGEYVKEKVPERAVRVRQGHRQSPRWFFNGDEMFPIHVVE